MTTTTSSSLSPWRDSEFALSDVAGYRDNVAELSARAHDAVLSPEVPGMWSRSWRLNVAAEICEANGLARRADGYRRQAQAEGAEDPADSVSVAGLRFARAVATAPKDMTEADLRALSAAGVPDADIVRLCELVAFVSYQCRVEIGHALLQWATP